MLCDIFKVVTIPETMVVLSKKNTPEQQETQKTTLALVYYTGKKSNIINAEAWGKLSDIAGKLNKGDIAYITGQLIRKEWEDSNGYKRHDFYLQIEQIKTLAPESKLTKKETQQNEPLPPELEEYQTSDDEGLPF